MGTEDQQARRNSAEKVSQKLYSAAHKVHTVAHDTKHGLLKHLGSGRHLQPCNGQADEHEPTGFDDLPAGVLDAIVRASCLRSLPAMRLTCKQWYTAVNHAVTALAPASCTPEYGQRMVSLFPSLVELSLAESTATVSKDTLSHLSKLSNLHSLDLTGCHFLGEAGLAQLGSCRQLHTVVLGAAPENPADLTYEYGLNSKVTDKMLQALTAIPSLTSIDIGWSERASKAGLLTLTSLSRLQSLTAITCPPPLTDEDEEESVRGSLVAADLEAIARAMPELTQLHTGAVAPAAFQAVASFGSKLASLELSGNRWERLALTSWHIRQLAAAPRLRHLGIAHYDLHSFEESHVGALAVWQDLTSLTIHECSVQPAFLQMLEAVLPQLTALHIHLDNEVGDATYAAVARLAAILGRHGGALREVDIRLPSKGDDNIPMLLLAELSSALSIRLGRAPDSDMAPALPCAYMAGRPVSLRCRRLELGRRLPLRLQALGELVRNRALERLSVHVAGPLPGQFSGLSNLTSLFLGLHETGAVPEGAFCLLGGLTQLESLELGCDDAISDSCVALLEPLARLTQLAFSSKFCEPAITRRALVSLAKLSKLRHLELTACTAFEEGDLALLAPLAHLRYLDLGPFTSFTDKALQYLEPMRSLKYLWLRVPRDVMFKHQKSAVQVSKATLAAFAAAHPVLASVWFGTSQLISFPSVTVNHQTLHTLADAHAQGKLESFGSGVWSIT